MARKLDVVTNVIAIATCLLASAVLLQKLDLLPRRAPAGAVELRTGEALPAVWQVRTTPARPTVVAVVRSTCRFCTESMPFYRDLVRKPVRLVAVSDEPPEVTRAYFSAHGIEPAQIVSAKPSGISGTPTLFAVDAAGTIRDRQVGLLTAEKQQQFLASMR
jgi:hypothetical protein